MTTGSKQIEVSPKEPEYPKMCPKDTISLAHRAVVGGKHRLRCGRSRYLNYGFYGFQVFFFFFFFFFYKKQHFISTI